MFSEKCIQVYSFTRVRIGFSLIERFTAIYLIPSCPFYCNIIMQNSFTNQIAFMLKPFQLFNLNSLNWWLMTLENFKQRILNAFRFNNLPNAYKQNEIKMNIHKQLLVIFKEDKRETVTPEVVTTIQAWDF